MLARVLAMARVSVCLSVTSRCSIYYLAGAAVAEDSSHTTAPSTCWVHIWMLNNIRSSSALVLNRKMNPKNIKSETKSRK